MRLSFLWTVQAASWGRRSAVRFKCTASPRCRRGAPRHWESTTRRCSKNSGSARAKWTHCARAVPCLQKSRVKMSESLIDSRSRSRRLHVVIIGGGFAGIAAVKGLRHCEADVTIIDRRNHHIFQPLLYQVATAVLAPADVAAPIRQLSARQKNVSVLLAEVVGVDLVSKTVEIKYQGAADKRVAFDYLVVAAGVQSSYFGHEEFAKYAPCLKTITDAQAIRSKILSAYELAEY